MLLIINKKLEPNKPTRKRAELFRKPRRLGETSGTQSSAVFLNTAFLQKESDFITLSPREKLEAVLNARKNGYSLLIHLS